MERRRRRVQADQVQANTESWKTMFQDMCDTVFSNDPIDNAWYIRIFTSKIPLVFHIMENELSSDQWESAAKFICDKCEDVITRFNGSYSSVAYDSCNRRADNITRYIVSMDTSIIVDVVISCLIDKALLYNRVIEDFIYNARRCDTAWIRTTRDYLCDIPPEVIPYVSCHHSDDLSRGKPLSYSVRSHYSKLTSQFDENVPYRPNKHTHDYLAYLSDD